MRQYRTIFLLSACWSTAELLLAVVGSVFHFFAVPAACADILNIGGAVTTYVALTPPGMVVVCGPASWPAGAVEVPMATTALVMAWAGLGILTSAALPARTQADRPRDHPFVIWPSTAP